MATQPIEKLAMVLTHEPTGETVQVDEFNFTQRLDAFASFQARVHNPYFFNNGDIIQCKFPRGDATTGYLYEWRGIVTARNFERSLITAYDYGSILRQPVKVDRNRFVGEDPAMAVLALIGDVDPDGLIDTAEIHGNDLNRFISLSDNVSGDNVSAWDMALRAVRSVVDDTNDGYVLPFHIYFENGDKLQIEKRQDVDDAATYPSVTDATYRDNLLGIKFRDRSDYIANKCTCVGLDGAEVIVEDLNSTQVYSPTSLDFRTRHVVIRYDSPNRDTLIERAWDVVNARKNAPAEYEIDMVRGEGIRLNSILNVTGEEWGVDGRFLVTSVTTTGAAKTVLTVSGEKLTLADVI